jgi:hypothetical protein
MHTVTRISSVFSCSCTSSYRFYTTTTTTTHKRKKREFPFPLFLFSFSMDWLFKSKGQLHRSFSRAPFLFSANASSRSPCQTITALFDSARSKSSLRMDHDQCSTKMIDYLLATSIPSVRMTRNRSRPLDCGTRRREKGTVHEHLHQGLLYSQLDYVYNKLRTETREREREKTRFGHCIHSLGSIDRFIRDCCRPASL